MMWSVVLGFIGIMCIALGVLLILAAAMPRWGGRSSEPENLPIGVGFILFGVFLIYKAGGVG